MASVPPTALPGMSTRRDSESDELFEETELEAKGFHFTISPFKSTGDAEEDQEVTIDFCKILIDTHNRNIARNC